MSAIFTDEEKLRLGELWSKSEKAGMSVWAYAVHTGRAKDLELTTVFRAMTDMPFCQDAIARRVESRGNAYARACAR